MMIVGLDIRVKMEWERQWSLKKNQRQGPEDCLEERVTGGKRKSTGEKAMG